MVIAKKAAGAKTTSAKAAGKKRASAGAKGVPAKDAGKRVSKGMPKGGQDPRGGLTAKGRKFFKETEGLHLRPGVKGKADTPEKMVRKGSFLRRHFANPQGPVKDKAGKPTRQALEAAAWGEPVPKSTGDEKKLADKGKKLLEQYHAIRDKEKSVSKSAAKKSGGKKVLAKTQPTKKAAAVKAVTRKAADSARKRVAGKKTASKGGSGKR